MDLFQRIIKLSVMQIIYVFNISLFLMISCNNAFASSEPKDVVRNTINEVNDVLKTHDIDSGESKSSIALIEQKITPNFDFIKMNKMVLGKSWANLSQPQQDNFAYQFRKLFIRTYTKTLSAYKNQNLEYLSGSASVTSNQVTVDTKMVKPESNVSISYELESTNEGWKIYNVLVDGVSLVTNYRSQFNTEIKQSGIDALNNKLAEKNGTVGDKITTVSQSFTVTPAASNSASTNSSSSQSNSYTAPSEPDPLFDIISGVTGIVVQNKINHDAKRQRQAVAQQRAYQQAQAEQQAYDNSRAQLDAQRAQQTQANTEIYVGPATTASSSGSSNNSCGGNPSASDISGNRALCQCRGYLFKTKEDGWVCQFQNGSYNYGCSTTSTGRWQCAAK